MHYRVKETYGKSGYSIFHPQFRFCFIWFYFYTESPEYKDQFSSLSSAQRWLKDRLKKTQYIHHKIEG